VKRDFWWTVVAVAALAGAIAGSRSTRAMPEPSRQQDKTKKSEPTGPDEGIQRGTAIFKKQCSACHYATSDVKKIGPGLKGLTKRGTFSVNGNKVTEESLKIWIETGDSMMPSFKDTLKPDELQDLIRYVRTM
jgi:cytochrome c